MAPLHPHIKKPLHSQNTPTTPHYLLFLLFLFLYFSTPTPTHSLNLTTLLKPYPDLSSFTNLLTSTLSLTTDLAHRSSLTLLAVPNSYLTTSLDLTHHSPFSLADLLRFHVLLQYLSWPTLHQIPPSGILITTLFQTTGRATSNSGSVNITRDPLTNTITIISGSSNVTVLKQIQTIPYNITILSVNSLIIPSNLDLLASETRPPLGLNITKALVDGHNFNVAVSMLTASGVVEELEEDEGGAGITLFIPTDTAFLDLPSSTNFQSLTADKKAVVLKFHVLHSYYPLGSLESIVNPVQPTLATEDMGAGRFTLNISRFNGSVCVDSGILQASVTQTVFDQNPVAIFGVSRVLLPKEYFGEVGTTTTPSSEEEEEEEVAVDGPAGSPSHREKIKSSDGVKVKRLDFCLFCILVYLLIL